MRFNTSIPSLLEATYILLCMFEILFMLGLAYFSISWVLVMNFELSIKILLGSIASNLMKINFLNLL